MYAIQYFTGSTALTGEAIVHVIVNDINDHSPQFDLPIYSTSLIEEGSKGQQVIRVTASDLDIGSNAEVRYSLVNNTAADYFNIDSVSGKSAHRSVLLCSTFQILCN